MRLALLLLGLLLLPPAPAEACTCLMFEVDEERVMTFRPDELVFTAHVTETDPVDGNDGLVMGPRVRVRVRRVFHGVVPWRLIHNPGWPGWPGSCLRELEPGRDYVVVGSWDASGQLQVSTCSLTQPIEDARHPPRWLGRGTSPPKPAAARTPPQRPGWALALAALAALFVLAPAPRPRR